MYIKGIKIVEVPVKDDECDEEWHTCPFKEDIHGDYESLCNCDEEQTRCCADGI